MKYLLLFGFLLLAMVAGAQDQLKSVSGKTYNCDVTDADQIFIYYRDTSPTVQRIPINTVVNVFISDSNKVQTLLSKSASFKILYENQGRIGGLGTDTGKEFPELLNEAGRSFESGSRLIITGVVISAAGLGIGSIVSTVDPFTGLLVTGISSLVAGITTLVGHVKNLEGAELLRQSGDAAIRQQQQPK